jgi:hypothetical protein
VVLFESLRLPGYESNKLDSDMLELFEKGYKTIADCETTKTKFTPDELALTELRPPIGIDERNTTIIEQWKTRARQDVRLKSIQLNQSRGHTSNKLKQVKGQVRDAAKSLVQFHNQLKKHSYEIVKIIKGMAGEKNAPQDMFKWLDNYTIYAENLKELAKELHAQSDSVLHAESLITDANQLLDESAKIHARLFALAESQNRDRNEDENGNESPTEDNENGLLVTNHKKRKDSKNKESKLQNYQQRNKTAVIIRNRIKAKLEGRDPDQANRKSVKEQVSNIISEARAIHNLALMYEGWTSWV